MSKEMSSNASTSHYVIGIDIGGTNFRMGAVLHDGTVQCAKVVSSRTFLQDKHPVESLINSIYAFCKEAPGTACGICIGFPGTVTKDKSTVTSCPNMPVFNGINIKKALSNVFNLPVLVEHEVVLLLSNDINRFQLSHHDCVIAVYVGTGLGNALYIHGKFVEGKNGNSGELGHIPMPGCAHLCPCGNTGCIELYASGRHLEQILQLHYPNCASFNEMLRLHGHDKPIRHFLDCVAVAVATEINILDPDVVLLGGGVLSIPAFPYQALLETIRLHTRKPYPEQNLCFVRSPSDPEQGARGAGLYWWSKNGLSM